MTDEPRLTSLSHGGGCGCKLAPNVLAEILAATPTLIAPAALLVDAATSDDAAVYQISDRAAIVATTDFFMPIVDDPFDFGRIAATNAISDIYAMGARPIFSLALVGMPVGKIPSGVIARILEGGASVAAAAGAPVAGGHSIDSVEAIYGLVALGLVDPDRILRNSTARAGDVLILGKPLGVGVFSAALKKNALSPEGYQTMIASTTRLNTPGMALAAIDGVHAMTDVTGFGLFGHLAEMCRGAGLAARIDADAVPVFPLARALVRDGLRTGASARNWAAIAALVDAQDDAPLRDLFTDPQTSGGLLVACAPDAVDAALAAFHREGHLEAAVIGEFGDGPARILVR
jgi:selenide,water dikinase